MTSLNAHTVARKALAAALTDNGFTIPLNGGSMPTSGYMASWNSLEVYVRLRTVNLSTTSVTDTLAAIERKIEGLNECGFEYFGGWIDDGLLYLDASEHFEMLEEAITFGREQQQLAIWDIDAGAEVRLMGGQR